MIILICLLGIILKKAYHDLLKCQLAQNAYFYVRITEATFLQTFLLYRMIEIKKWRKATLLSSTSFLRSKYLSQSLFYH